MPNSEYADDEEEGNAKKPKPKQSDESEKPESVHLAQESPSAIDRKLEKSSKTAPPSDLSVESSLKSRPSPKVEDMQPPALSEKGKKAKEEDEEKKKKEEGKKKKEEEKKKKEEEEKKEAEEKQKIQELPRKQLEFGDRSVLTRMGSSWADPDDPGGSIVPTTLTMSEPDFERTKPWEKVWAGVVALLCLAGFAGTLYGVIQFFLIYNDTVKHLELHKERASQRTASCLYGEWWCMGNGTLSRNITKNEDDVCPEPIQLGGPCHFPVPIVEVNESTPWTDCVPNPELQKKIKSHKIVEFRGWQVRQLPDSSAAWALRFPLVNASDEGFWMKNCSNHTHQFS